MLYFIQNFELINHCSRKIRDVIIPSFDPSLFRLMLLISSPINGCTALIPKKAFEDIGLFNLHRPHTSDYELFFNMASKYTFIHMPQILVKTRSHRKQRTNVKIKYHNYESNLFLIQGLQKINDEEIQKANWEIPDVYLFIAVNWATRGYKQAYLKALEFYKNRGGNNLNAASFYLECAFKYFIKYFRKRIRSIVLSIKKLVIK